MKKLTESMRRNFITLRGCKRLTYRQIQTELGISRPTIAKWCRLYEKQIRRSYTRMMAKERRRWLEQCERDWERRNKDLIENLEKIRQL